MTRRSAYGLDVEPERVTSWGERAACLMGGRLGDPEAWFITSKKTTLTDPDNRAALYICQYECPVQAECDEATLQIRKQFPIMGEIRGGQWFDAAGRVHYTAKPGGQ